MSVRKRVVSREDGLISSGSCSVKILRGQVAARQKNLRTESSKRMGCPVQGRSRGFLRYELWTVDDGVDHTGQSEVGRVEVTRTSNPSAVSLIAVMSRPSGSGNKGVVGIYATSHQL